MLPKSLRSVTYLMDIGHGHDEMVRGENVCTVGVRPTEDRLMMALDGSDSWSPLNPTYSP